MVKTLHCNDDPNPVFNSFHDLGFRPLQDAAAAAMALATGGTGKLAKLGRVEPETLLIKVYDFDTDGETGNLISQAEVSIAHLSKGGECRVDMTKSSADGKDWSGAYPNFAVTLRRHHVRWRDHMLQLAFTGISAVCRLYLY